MMYRELTYLEFLVMPSLFNSYIDELMSSGDQVTIRDIFTLYSMTLLEWVGKDITMLDTTLPFDAIISSKLKNKRMFGLLLIIGLKTGLSPSYFQSFLGNRQYAAHYFRALRLSIAAEKQLDTEVLAEYFADRFLYEEIKSTIKEEQLKGYALQFQELVKYKVNRVRGCQSGELKRAYSELLVEVHLALKMRSSLGGCVQGIMGYLPIEFQVRVTKFLQVSPPVPEQIIIEPEIEQNRTVNAASNNRYLLICRTRDRTDLLELKLAECFSYLDQKNVADTRQMIQKSLSMSESVDEKTGFYCLLLALKIMNTDSLSLSNEKFLGSEVQTTYSDITQLGAPPLRSLKWLVMALCYASNYFNEIQFKQLGEFMSKILVARQNSNDRNFICIVLLQALLDLRNDGADASEKIQWFWRYVTEAKQMLFQAMGNFEAMRCVLSIAYHRLCRKLSEKVFSNQFLNVRAFDLFQSQIQAKFKPLTLPGDGNFTQQQLLEIIDITKRTLQSLKLQSDHKTQQLQFLQVQRLKVLFLDCQKQSSAEIFLKEVLNYACTFHYPCKNMAERVPDYADLKVLFKMMSIAYTVIDKPAESFICYQLSEDAVDSEKAFQFIIRNQIRQELFKFINHIEILQMLLSASALARMDERTKFITELMQDDNYYQFNSENRTRKIQFRKQLDFVRYMLGI